MLVFLEIGIISFSSAGWNRTHFLSLVLRRAWGETLNHHYYIWGNFWGIFVGEVVVAFSSTFCFLVERRSRLEVSLSRLPTCRQRSHGANPQWWVCGMSTHFLWVTTSTTNYSFKIGKCLHLPCQKGAIITMMINRDDEDDENLISKTLRTTTGSWRTMESSTNFNFSLPTVSFLLFIYSWKCHYQRWGSFVGAILG